MSDQQFPPAEDEPTGENTAAFQRFYAEGLPAEGRARPLLHRVVERWRTRRQAGRRSRRN